VPLHAPLGVGDAAKGEDRRDHASPPPARTTRRARSSRAASSCITIGAPITASTSGARSARSSGGQIALLDDDRVEEAGERTDHANGGGGELRGAEHAIGRSLERLPANDRRDADNAHAARAGSVDRVAHAADREDRRDGDHRIRRCDDDQVGAIERLCDFRSDARLVRSVERHLEHLRLRSGADEPWLELHPALGCAKARAHGVVAGDEDRRVGEREATLQRSVHLGESFARSQLRGTVDVDRQIAVAELEPVGCPDLAELVERTPTLSGQPPAAFAVADPCEGVHEGVVIRADREAVQFEVVARIGDDGKFAARERAIETVGELRTADASGE